MLSVTTASGKRQKFDPKKIHRTCLRAGASRSLANDIVEEVTSQLHDGISTRKILKMVLDALRQHQAEDIASRYDLKSAIMRMGPAGFAFETFLAQVLENYGYRTKLRQRVKGLCVEQEIDIVMEKGGERSMVEVKYHNASGIYTGLKEAMYTYSRFLDLQQGHEVGTCQRFDQAWLATNTRSSLEARKYAMCKGIRLLGWKHPRNRGVETLIEKKCLYPVTVLHSLDKRSFEALGRANMMLVSDLTKEDPRKVSNTTGLPLSEVERLAHQAEKILEDPLLRSRAEG